MKTLKNELQVVITAYKLAVFEILRDFEIFILTYITYLHCPYI